jgi:hypothetical protein
MIPEREDGGNVGGVACVARLRSNHREELMASGLSDSQIAACGFYSIETPVELKQVLNWGKGSVSRHFPGLAIPFLHAGGHTRVKLDHPRKDKDGKPIKYESPVGVGNRAYFPPGTIAALTDPSAPLIVTEGEKKAAKADQEGFACVGLVGVWGWPKPRPEGKDGEKTGARELIDDLDAIVWTGRKVYVVFDSDVADKPGVLWAEWSLAKVLEGRGATVLVVRLPKDAGTNAVRPEGPAKVGLDDFLIARGPVAFRDLLAKTRPAERPHVNGDAESGAVQAVALGKTQRPPADQPTAVVRPAAALVPGRVEWLWPSWIPLRAVSLLDGDPGLGKSTLTIDWTARASRGWAWPPAAGGVPVAEPVGVLLLSAEDDPERTIRPRLDAAGADLQRVHGLDAIRTGDAERPPVLPLDLDLIESRVVEHGIRLVVVDPLMAYLAGEIDAHKDSDVRRAMHQLKLLAERTGAAVLVVRHLNKLIGGPALYRGGGSIGIIGAVRSATVVGRDPGNPDHCILAPTKCNLCKMPRALAYTHEPAGDVSRIAWSGESDLTADDILVHAGPKKQSEVERCADALRELLAGGGMESDDLSSALSGMGYSAATQRRARQAARVRTQRVGFGAEGRWVATIPPPAEEPIPD